MLRLGHVVRAYGLALLLLTISPTLALAQSAAEYEAWLEWCESIGTPNYDPSNPVCTPNAGSSGGQVQQEEIPPTPEEEFRAYLDSAHRLVNQGKLDRARDELAEALLLFPDDAEALALKQQLDGTPAPAAIEPPVEQAIEPPPPEVQSETVALAPAAAPVPALPALPPPPPPKPASVSWRSLRLVEVPSPTGYKSASERREQVERLSDERIDAEIGRVEALLWRMQEDFEADTGSLEEWLEVAEDAEREALLASFDLLTSGTVSAVLKNKERLKNLYEMAKTATLFLKAGEVVSAAEREAQLKLARDAMLQLYENVRIFDKELATEVGKNAAELASFAVSYSYEVWRWAVARENILSISDNLGAPEGKLKAQLAVKRLYEDLIQERNRRLAAVEGQ
jgi:hypothetical protein